MSAPAARSRRADSMSPVRAANSNGVKPPVDRAPASEPASWSTRTTSGCFRTLPTSAASAPPPSRWRERRPHEPATL